MTNKNIKSYLKSYDFNIEDDEEFKIIKNKKHKTNYIISNYGYVISLNYRSTKTPHIINQEINRGYCRVTLFINGNKIHKRVHRLVAEYFIPNPYNLESVDHIDNNKRNNNYKNLQWITEIDNKHKAHIDGLYKYGIEHHNCNSTVEGVNKICQLLEQNELSISEIANQTNSSVNIVSSIYHKKSWVNISKNYNISNFSKIKENNKLDDKFVDKICKLIAKGYTNKQISEKSCIKKYIINDIKQRKTYTHISNKYIF